MSFPRKIKLLTGEKRNIRLFKGIFWGHVLRLKISRALKNKAKKYNKHKTWKSNIDATWKKENGENSYACKRRRSRIPITWSVRERDLSGCVWTHIRHRILIRKLGHSVIYIYIYIYIFIFFILRNHGMLIKRKPVLFILGKIINEK